METFEITLPSALFPFTLTDLPDFVHDRYRLQNVFRSASPSEQQACVEFWIRGGVIVSPKAAWERSREVCYLLKEVATDRLVGLNSLYPDGVPGGGPTVFQNRMYIHPDFRDSRLMIVATAATLCYAKTRLDGEGIPGIVNVNENTKLARPGMRRIFSRLGYRRLPQQGARDAWYFDFAHTRIREAGGTP